MRDPQKAFPAPSGVSTSLLVYPLSRACQGSAVTRAARPLWGGHVDSTAHTAELPMVSSEDIHRKLWKGSGATASEGASSVDTSVTSATNLFCFLTGTSDTES